MTVAIVVYKGLIPVVGRILTVKTLRAFKRVFVPAGKTVNVHITLSKKDLEWWNEATHSIQFCPGEYQVWIGGSSDEKALSKYAIQLK